MKLFTAVLLAAIAVFAFKDEISVYAGKAKSIADRSSAVSRRAAELERFGGKRTAADLRWTSDMNVLCARRNNEEHGLAGPQDTARSVARYTAQALATWDRYARRAAALPVPKTSAPEAEALRAADRGRRRAMARVLSAARSGDLAAAYRAVDAYLAFAQRVRPTLLSIGLHHCADAES